MGKRISITGKDGFHFGAFWEEPEGKPKGGVVVCQEIFGVNQYLENVCHFYAKAGYLTIAPALFDRIERDLDIKYSPEGVQRGIQISSKVDWDQALDDVESSPGHGSYGGSTKVWRHRILLGWYTGLAPCMPPRS